jgi:hypothetical protein
VAEPPIPGPLAPFLLGRKFQAQLPDGQKCGGLASQETGATNIYGFAPFMRIAALEEGDVLRMTFELKQSIVVLEPVDEMSLEE